MNEYWTFAIYYEMPYTEFDDFYYFVERIHVKRLNEFYSKKYNGNGIVNSFVSMIAFLASL